MPTYEYECEKCGFLFEELQSFNDPDRLPCPKCGSNSRRLISPGAGLIFKGSGFYITDYARKDKPQTKPSTKSTPVKKESEKSPPKSETKGSSKDTSPSKDKKNA